MNVAQVVICIAAGNDRPYWAITRQGVFAPRATLEELMHELGFVFGTWRMVGRFLADRVEEVPESLKSQVA